MRYCQNCMNNYEKIEILNFDEAVLQSFQRESFNNVNKLIKILRTNHFRSNFNKIKQIAYGKKYIQWNLLNYSKRVPDEMWYTRVRLNKKNYSTQFEWIWNRITKFLVKKGLYKINIGFYLKICIAKTIIIFD